MLRYVPFARSDVNVSNVKDIISWLRVDELLETTKRLSPNEEFLLLIEFLIQFSGGYELSKCRVYEMYVEQARLSYEAYAEAVKRIKDRIIEIYNEKKISCGEFVMSELGDVDTGKQYKPRKKCKNVITQQISLFDTK